MHRSVRQWLLPLVGISLIAATVLDARPQDRSWAEDVIYFTMTDRFHDGDPANNVPEGSDRSLYDPAQENLDKYHGGDLRGLERAIQSGYFNALGVTAIWITPPVRNVWRSGYDLGGWKSGYHGYWAQDFLDIDPHLTSTESLAGTPYPPGQEGRMQHYRDFVRLAHAKGLKVVQDVVLNHAGPVFYYDANGNGKFEREQKDEWVQPYKRDGFHQNARWGDVPEWNMQRTAPFATTRLLDRDVKSSGVLGELSSYGRKGFSWESLGKSDGEEVMCDFFSLRDFWTEPGSEHFDRLVDEFVEIYHFYLTEVGVDGLRLDTVKHAHHGFWDAFTERLRKRLGPAAREKIIFGEVYDGNPAKLGQYTWRSDAATNPEPCIDSLLAFQLCFAMREYLRQPGNQYGSPRSIEGAMLAFAEGRFDDGRYYYNRSPGPDGLNSLQKSITFIENHDGLNRFRVNSVTERRHQLAQAMVMTLPGIPCLYYGAETGMHDTKGKIGEDGETGRMTLWERDAAPSLATVRQQDSFSTIARLASARQKVTALREGEFRPLWTDSGDRTTDDGIFAFARVMPDTRQSVVVAFNASDQDGKTGPLNLNEIFPDGCTLHAHPLVGEAPDPAGGKELAVPANSVVLYRVAAP